VLVERLRAAIERRLSRLRDLGWRGLISIERDTARRLLKTTLAATLAWVAADALGSPRPALAALGAIIVLQVTVRASLARSIQLTVGVTAGLATAVFLGQFLGLHWWSVGLMVLAGLTLGEILRLGPAAPQAAVSALLALSFGSTYGAERVTDTIIGAAIAVVINALIAPTSYVHQAARALRSTGEDLGFLLGDIGRGLVDRREGGPSQATVDRWLDRARDIAADVRKAAETVRQGAESVRYNHRARGELHDLERLTESRRAIDHVATQVRGIARTLLDIRAGRDADAVGWPEVEATLVSLGEVLAQSGRAVAAFARLQETPTSTADRGHATTAQADASAAAQRLSTELATIPVEQLTAQRLLSSILVDAARLLHEVDPQDGAHASAVTPQD
jgi:uncharacterized membrane protein YccC